MLPALFRDKHVRSAISSGTNAPTEDSLAATGGGLALETRRNLNVCASRSSGVSMLPSAQPVSQLLTHLPKDPPQLSSVTPSPSEQL